MVSTLEYAVPTDRHTIDLPYMGNKTFGHQICPDNSFKAIYIGYIRLL